VSDGSPYRILVVCTGNICRSPFAERLLRARLRERLGDAAEAIEVSSAGTWGLVGKAMMPEAAATLRRYGGDPEGFVACALTAEQIEAADLILCLTREHRADVVLKVPSASSRVATLRQYSRLLEGVSPEDIDAPPADPAARFRAVTAAAFARRGHAPAASPDDDDVPDPFGLELAAYERAAAMIDRSLEVPLSLLAPAS
jgi:protein-tyrosine phosphatase